MSLGADPGEEEEGSEEDAGDDCVDVAEAAVGEEGGKEAAGEVGGVHEDEEGDGGVGGEVEVGLGVGYYEVEAEVDAPEGEEEAWMLGVLVGGFEIRGWGLWKCYGLVERMYLPADIRRNGISVNISRPS